MKKILLILIGLTLAGCGDSVESLKKKYADGDDTAACNLVKHYNDAMPDPRVFPETMLEASSAVHTLIRWEFWWRNCLASDVDIDTVLLLIDSSPFLSREMMESKDARNTHPKWIAFQTYSKAVDEFIDDSMLNNMTLNVTNALCDRFDHERVRPVPAC